MVENDTDLNNNSAIQWISHLGIPTKYQYLNNIMILIPTDGFFYTIIDVDYWHLAFMIQCTYVITCPTLVRNLVSSSLMLLALMVVDGDKVRIYPKLTLCIINIWFQV